MKTIKITEYVEQSIIDEGLFAFPNECCGFLFGIDSDEDRLITQILVVHNTKKGDKKRRFEISPLDYLKAEQYADENKMTLLGVYHSHPNHPSVPSEHDRIAAQPFFSYIIVAVRKSEFVSLQSWTLNDEFQFKEENITVLKDTFSKL